MDPNATLVALVLACQHGESANARDHARDLYEWLAKDGAVPTIDLRRHGKNLVFTHDELSMIASGLMRLMGLAVDSMKIAEASKILDLASKVVSMMRQG